MSYLTKLIENNIKITGAFTSEEKINTTILLLQQSKIDDSLFDYEFNESSKEIIKLLTLLKND